MGLILVVQHGEAQLPAAQDEGAHDEGQRVWPDRKQRKRSGNDQPVGDEHGRRPQVGALDTARELFGGQKVLNTWHAGHVALLMA